MIKSIEAADFAVGQIRAQCDVLARRLDELREREGEGALRNTVIQRDEAERLNRTMREQLDREAEINDALRAELHVAKDESKKNFEALCNTVVELRAAERDLAAVLRVQADHQRYAGELLQRARAAEEALATFKATRP